MCALSICFTYCRLFKNNECNIHNVNREERETCREHPNKMLDRSRDRSTYKGMILIVKEKKLHAQTKRMLKVRTKERSFTFLLVVVYLLYLWYCNRDLLFYF